MKKALYLLCILLLPFFVNAQITVVPAATAATLANKLLGPGVIMFNPVLTCATNAEGTFSGISTISFDSGIVLTSGNSVDVANPASFFASTANGTPGDAQLTALAGQPTNDACVLQFDFRPAGDTIKFEYVFGSEEYTDFTCSEFNDVFGFFISGPGIAGSANIALVPGTTIPVCINSVNCGGTGGSPTSPGCTSLGAGSPFCSYYVNNSAGTTIAYDGLTVTLTAIAAVTPCDTYHLKIGVADAVDDILDSGVFLKAGSLTSTGISVSPVGINPSDTGFGAQYCVRECTPGKFVFHATGSLADSTVIHFLVGGTAINGFDYSTIPDSVVIPAHDSTDTLYIYGLAVPPTGPKTVELYIYGPFSCGGVPTIIDSAELTIYDSLFVQILTPDTAICLGQSVTINTAGSSSLVYSWSPAATLSSSTVQSPVATPVVTTTYTVSALYAGSGCAPSTDEITVYITTLAALNVGPPVQSICVGSPLQLGVTASPAGGYTYNWTPATYLNNATIPNPIVTPGVVGNFEYVVTVGSAVPGCMATDSFLLHVLPNDFTLTSPDTGVCFFYGPFQVIASGDSEFSYQWSPSMGVSNPYIIDPSITPPGPGSYTYVITASYPGCPNMVHNITYTIEAPNVDILIGDTTFCIGTTIPIPVVITPAGEAYTFAWSTPTAGLSDPSIIDPGFFMPTAGSYSYTLTITSPLGCTSSDSVTFNTAPPIVIGIAPGNTTIDYGQSIQLNAFNLSVPATPLIWYWYPNDGTLTDNNINNPIATPTDSSETYTVIAMNEAGCRDTLSETISVDRDVNECIPAAFSPNNDGLNDVFRVCAAKYQRLVEFAIFNRWGQKIYDNTTDISKGWDGTFNGVPQDIGVYNYMVIIAKPDGTNKTYNGSVTLIR